MHKILNKILVACALFIFSACGQLSENSHFQSTKSDSNLVEIDKNEIEQIGTCAPVAIAGIWQFKSEGETVKSFLYGPKFSSLNVKLNKFNKVLSSDVKVVDSCEAALKACMNINVDELNQKELQCKHFGLRKLLIKYPDLKILF